MLINARAKRREETSVFGGIVIHHMRRIRRVTTFLRCNDGKSSSCSYVGPIHPDERFSVVSFEMLGDVRKQERVELPEPAGFAGELRGGVCFEAAAAA